MQASGVKLAAGRCYAFLGGPTLSTVAWITSDGEAANDWLGNSVAAGAGYFGGGRGALAGGAPYNDRGGSNAGRSYVCTAGSPVAVEAGTVPVSQCLVQPNPSRVRVRVQWSSFPVESHAVRVTDILGRVVRILPVASAGSTAQVTWDDRDEAGRRVASGVYLLTPAIMGGMKQLSSRLIARLVVVD